MKVFYESTYRYYNSTANPGLKLFLISDIHFSHTVRSQTLAAIADRIVAQKPDYILIPGDLVDSLTEIDEPNELKRFISFIERIAKVAPVLACLGNHDFYRVPKGSKNNIWSNWEIAPIDALRDAFKEIPNAFILDNKTYEQDNILVFGFTQTPEYFSLDIAKKGSGDVRVEDKNIFIHDLNQVEKSRFQKLPKNKLKVALVHSPLHFNDPEVCEFFKEYDLIICGHMHNGATPPILQDFWFTDRGLAAPGRSAYLPERTRVGIYGPDNKLILCGPVTTIQAHANPLTPLNHCFPVHIGLVEVSDNPTFKRKPSKKRKYISFK